MWCALKVKEAKLAIRHNTLTGCALCGHIAVKHYVLLCVLHETDKLIEKPSFILWNNSIWWFRCFRLFLFEVQYTLGESYLYKVSISYHHHHHLCSADALTKSWWWSSPALLLHLMLQFGLWSLHLPLTTLHVQTFCTGVEVEREIARYDPTITTTIITSGC